MTSFSDLKLSQPLLRALAEQDHTTPTPIQVAAIPALLEGRDLLGMAQTGTGKTAAFALPLLDRLTAENRRPAPRTARVLVLTPTRELALQVAESFKLYGRHLRLSLAAVLGGVGQHPQVRALSRGVDVLVATPGRLQDLLDQGHVKLGAVETLVLDEADRMLDMGFLPAVRRIVGSLPPRRQTVMFSATLPDAVKSLAAGLLFEPTEVSVSPVTSTADRVQQQVLFVEKANKRALLTEMLQNEAMERTLVFARTKHSADRLASQLARSGVRADAIHGDKTQGARQKALRDFRHGHVRVLVATDIAARGIDVQNVTHVVNFDLPNEPESYVHRIGRTARAGAAGIALSFCDMDEVPFLLAIEKTIRQTLPAEIEHAYHAPQVAAALAGARGARNAPRKSGNGKRRGPPSRGPRPAPTGKGGYGAQESRPRSRQRPALSA
jgi:ATP-dependent RNA helicase RhlE